MGHRRGPTSSPTDPSAPSAARPTWPSVVEATTRAARIAGIARPSSPWLPPLPDLVVADRLLADPWHVPYALADLPRQQAQRPVTWDLENDGHLAVAGASRTGRTSFLRTLAGTIATRLSPDDVHLYAFDGAAGGLLPLSGLPHTGSVVTRDEAARGRPSRRPPAGGDRARRQRLMAEHGYGSLAEQRRAALGPARDGATRPTTGTALPYLVVLVDGWEALVSGWEARDRGRTLDAMLRVLREGQAIGIRAVVAGDRGVLASRVGAAMSEKLVLRLADATDLLMAGIDSAAVPVHQPPGRALRLSDAVEMQLALLDGGAWKRRPGGGPGGGRHAPVRQRVPPSVATSPRAPGRRSAWTPAHAGSAVHGGARTRQGHRWRGAGRAAAPGAATAATWGRRARRRPQRRRGVGSPR